MMGLTYNDRRILWFVHLWRCLCRWPFTNVYVVFAIFFCRDFSSLYCQCCILCQRWEVRCPVPTLIYSFVYVLLFPSSLCCLVVFSTDKSDTITIGTRMPGVHMFVVSFVFFVFFSFCCVCYDIIVAFVSSTSAFPLTDAKTNRSTLSNRVVADKRAP